MHLLVEHSRVPRLFNKVFGEPMHGVAIYPFIFTITTGHEHPFVYNHEKIHIAQLEETLIFGFYIMMILSFIRNLYVYKNVSKSYQNIIFEVEAYKHMHNLEYLKTRKRFSWFRESIK
jgi:hypothetical protein